MKLWSRHETARKSAQAKFEKDADRIMIKAMDADADASEIIELLHEAAQKSGLKSLKAPEFEQ